MSHDTRDLFALCRSANLRGAGRREIPSIWYYNIPEIGDNFVKLYNARIYTCMYTRKYIFAVRCSWITPALIIARKLYSRKLFRYFRYIPIQPRSHASAAASESSFPRIISRYHK